MLSIVYILLAVAFILLAHEVLRLLWYLKSARRLGAEAAFFSHAFNTHAKNVLVIGDSTSYGTGVQDKTRSLAGRLAADMPEYAVVNLSENGMSLKRLCENLAKLEDAYEHTFIHIGGVDTLTFTPLATVSSRMRAAIQKAKKITRGRVFLISVNNSGAVPAYRFPFAQLLSKRSRQVSMISDAVCMVEGVTHVPLWRRAKEDMLGANPSRLIARDLMHPTDEGYGVWYEQIRQALQP